MATSPGTAVIPPDGAQHFEVFRLKKHTGLLRLPCWCSIARNHRYDEWVEAGSPDVRGGGAPSAGGSES